MARAGGPFGRLVQRFTNANRRLCERVAGRLPHTRVNVFDRYADKVANLVPPGGVAIDAGAGATTPFASSALPSSAYLVGLDITAVALEANKEIDAAVVADLSSAIPLRDMSVDVVASRSFLEHLPETEGFFRECTRVLRPGGSLMCLAPGRYSWFALLNRMIPRRVARRMLFALHPESVDAGGMDAHYTALYPAAVRRTLASCGLDDISIEAHYGTNYGYSFVPLFIVTSVIEIVLKALRLERLCSTMLIRARKPSAPSTSRGC
jgi:SAM-dependent methyltransferase